MIDLVLAILSSALVSVMMRLGERHGKGRVSMLLCNYILCTALAAAFSGFKAGKGMTLTAGLGLFNGCLYLGSFLLLQRCIQRSGVILSSTFMKLGVMVPTVLSVIVFREQPGVLQVIGILLSVAAILLMNGGKAERVTGLAGLVILLIAGGVTDGMSMVYEHVGNAQNSGIFLLITFGTALMLCTVLTAVRHQRVTKADVIDGVLIGIPNYFCAMFLLSALGSVPAVIVYPCFSVGTIAAVSAAGLLLFGERLTKRQWAAMAVIAAALVLLNI